MGQGAMAPDPCLDARLFIGGEHELIVGEWVPLPYALVEVKDPSRLGSEVRVARKDPTAVLPGTNRILVEPAPDGCIPDAGDESGSACLSSDITDAKAGERQTTLRWQFTGQRFDLDDHFWGGKPWGDQGEDVLLGRARRCSKKRLRHLLTTSRPRCRYAAISSLRQPSEAWRTI